MDTEDLGNPDPPLLQGPALGQGLEPLIRSACDDRLSPITWFRTDWQHGGAATGRARLIDETGEAHEVMIKIPVSPRELTWLRRLQGNPSVPVLHASGDVLGGYDLAWVIIEWFPFGPLGKKWHCDHFARSCTSAAHFHDSAHKFPIDKPAPREDWETLIRRSRTAIQTQSISNANEWKNALKQLSRRLSHMVEFWRNRTPLEWIHGDLHLANCMSRVSMEEGPVSLIDLAEVRPGHWIEDAIYLERIYWSRPSRLKDNSPVKHLARARKALGLDVSEDHPRLADIRRALYAATCPAFLRTEGGAHLKASLVQLQASLGRIPLRG